MTLSGIRPGDVVRCDVRGVTFHAIVEVEPVDGGLSVRPIERGVSYRRVTARQVVAHWRRSARSRTGTTR